MGEAEEGEEGEVEALGTDVDGDAAIVASEAA